MDGHISSPKGPGRGLLLGLGAGLLLAVAGYWAFGGFANSDPRGTGSTTERDASTAGGPESGTEPATTEPGASEREPGTGGREVVTSDTVVGSRLRFVDAQNRQELEGVRCFDLEERRELGRSGRDGSLELRQWDPRRVAFFGPGYLARTLGEAEQRAAREAGRAGSRLDVPIHVDRWTRAIRVRFSGLGASGPQDVVRLLVSRQDGQPEHPRDFPSLLAGPGRAVSPEQQRAWERHQWLASQLPLPDPYYLGRELPITVPDPGAFELRFSHAGSYAVRAWTRGASPRIGELRARVVASTEELRIEMRPAASLQLLVQDAQQKPVAGARVTAQSVRSRRLPTRHARCDAEGGARIEGLFPGEGQRVRVLADGFALYEGTLAPGDREQRIVLQSLPSIRHSLLVVEKGTKKPIEGATLLLGDPSRSPVQVRTNAAGRAEFPLLRDAPRVLEVRSAKHITWRELLQFGVGPLPTTVELIPEGRDEQRAAALVAVLRGHVLDASGKPLAGERVLLEVPEHPLGKPGERSQRQILGGHRVPERHFVMTGSDGAFELYTAHRGAARLLWQGSPGANKPVQVVPGRVHEIDFGGKP